MSHIIDLAKYFLMVACTSGPYIYHKLVVTSREWFRQETFMGGAVDFLLHHIETYMTFACATFSDAKIDPWI